MAFAAMIISFVVRARHHKVELVSADYYAQELKYEDRIQATNNTNELAQKPVVTTRAGGIQLIMPELQRGKRPEGTIQFYCPAGSQNDMMIPLNLDENYQQQIATSNLAKGLYLFKLEWMTDGVPYYFEQQITIP